MTGDSGLVSIGMPLYNGAAHIAEAISSVLQSSHPNWELILLDDASTDNSLNVARTFRDPRIRILENQVNGGLVAARNRILDEAHGSLVAWLDQDDLTYPHRVKAQVDFFRAHPHAVVCGGWANIRREGPAGRVKTTREVLPQHHRDIRAHMLFTNPLKCNTVMMRADVLRQAGLRFRSEFGNALDYDLWSQVSDHLELHNLPRVLGEYRVHATQTSRGEELDKINRSALQVQKDLVARSLGIPMSETETLVHQRLTLRPRDLVSDREVMATAEWLRTVRLANTATGAFDAQSLDDVLARQWLTALAGAARSGLASGSVARVGWEGGQHIGLRKSSFVGELFGGVSRLLERAKPWPPS